MTKFRHVLPLATLFFFLSLGAFHRSLSSQPPAGPTLQGDRAHPAHAQGWVDTRLYFGLGPANVPSKGVSDQDWLDFLDKEVTPRFPSGLSVLDVYGQWQGADETEPERVRTKLLVIDYPSTPDNEARVDAIRAAWKKRTGDKSVLKVTQGVEVSF